MADTRSRFDALVSSITEESVQDMDEEEVKELLSQLNPYRYVGNCNDKYLNFSFTKQRDSYQEKFLISAMVAYLFQGVTEWKVPKGIKPVSVEEWAKDPSLADTPKSILENGSDEAKEAYEANRKFMKYRAVVMAFLESLFQFNPMVHCRPGYRPNPNDTDREPITTKAGETAHKFLLATDKDYKAAVELKQDLDELNRSKPKKPSKKTKKKAREKEEQTELAELAAYAMDEDHRAEVELERFYDEMNQSKSGNAPATEEDPEEVAARHKRIIEEMKKHKPKKAPKRYRGGKKRSQKKEEQKEEPVPELVSSENAPPTEPTTSTSPAASKPTTDTPSDSQSEQTPYCLMRKYIPPSDLFYRFRIFQDENIENLRKFVTDCYGEVMQLDLALQPISVHDTEQDAEEYKKKLANEFTVDVFTAQFGKWNMLESSAGRRENVRYYNKKNQIFEEIIDQTKRDTKLGTELLGQTISRAKKKNIAEEGPDAEGLRRWKEENTQLKQLGAEFSKLDPDLPEDAVQTEIWNFDDPDNPKTVAFLEAEAPTQAFDGGNTFGGPPAPAAVPAKK
jgi:hypothetical protein